MGKCPRENCNGDTHLRWELGQWYEHCILCERDTPANIPEGSLNPRRYADGPYSPISAIEVKYRPNKAPTRIGGDE